MTTVSTEPTQPIVANQLLNVWRCKNGHILGRLLSEKRGRYHTTRLLLFRIALLPTDAVPNGVAFAKLDAGEVMCGICGEVRHWYADPHHT